MPAIKALNLGSFEQTHEICEFSKVLDCEGTVTDCVKLRPAKITPFHCLGGSNAGRLVDIVIPVLSLCISL